MRGLSCLVACGVFPRPRIELLSPALQSSYNPRTLEAQNIYLFDCAEVLVAVGGFFFELGHVGSNLGPLYWECRVVVTGSQGKSLVQSIEGSLTSLMILDFA